MPGILVGQLRDLIERDLEAAASATLAACRVAVSRIARRQRFRDSHGELAAEVAERIIVLDPGVLRRARAELSVVALAIAIGRHALADVRRASARGALDAAAQPVPRDATWRAAFLRAHPVETWARATTGQALAVFAVAVANLKPVDAARLLGIEPNALRGRTARGVRAIKAAGTKVRGDRVSARLRKALVRLANSREELRQMALDRGISLGGRARRTTIRVIAVNLARWFAPRS